MSQPECVVVRESLSDLLKICNLSVTPVLTAKTVKFRVDDVLSTYLTSLLMDIDRNNIETEVDDLKITIDAYVPGFEQSIDNAKLCSWLEKTVCALEEFVEANEATTSAETSNKEEIKLSLSHEPECERTNKSNKSKLKCSEIELDPDLKNNIITKHSYVSTTEPNDRPRAPPNLTNRPTEEKSKMRYLDGKVVSVKGERFVDTKKEESDEMKKTYVHLKPLRKYRFH